MIEAIFERHEWAINTAAKALIAGELMLAAVVMPDYERQERIDPVDIDRFSAVGMGSSPRVRALADALCSVDHAVPHDEFLIELGSVLADVLQATLPIPTIDFDDDLEGKGRFSSGDWSILLTGRLIEEKSESKENLIDLFDTLTHELRHAEQYYAAARYQAGLAASRKDPTAKIDRRSLSPYAYLPDSVAEAVLANPATEGSDDFEFGKFILAVHVNDELREKEDYIDEIISDPDVTSDEYDYYYKIVNTKLPSERDSNAVQKKLRHAAEDCLEPW